MGNCRRPTDLSPDEIGSIEKQSLRGLFTAATDFGFDAFDIFEQSSDDPKDTAEDITREMLDRLGGYQVQQRILGNVDYRKARYIILPDFAVRQALFVDSRAEKSSNSATMQMSQLSLEVRQERSGQLFKEQGHLPAVSVHGSKKFITTTLLAHYYYTMNGTKYQLAHLTLASIPRRRGEITRQLVLETWAKYLDYNRRQIAALLNCSEQTVDRRMKGNNIRGGKYVNQTRVKLVGGLIEDYALEAGLYLYDRRVWVKDAAWENSKWHTVSYRAVDEFEYIYIFWKPGPAKIDRNHLAKDEWKSWGSRGVWNIPSVRANYDHEAKFPLEIPRRCIQLLTDHSETVLDCFVGSGTSAIASISEGRRFIGIDLEPKSVEMSQKALRIALREKRHAQLHIFEGKKASAA